MIIFLSRCTLLFIPKSLDALGDTVSRRSPTLFQDCHAHSRFQDCQRSDVDNSRNVEIFEVSELVRISQKAFQSRSLVTRRCHFDPRTVLPATIVGKPLLVQSAPTITQITKLYVVAVVSSNLSSRPCFLRSTRSSPNVVLRVNAASPSPTRTRERQSQIGSIDDTFVVRMNDATAPTMTARRSAFSSIDRPLAPCVHRMSIATAFHLRDRFVPRSRLPDNTPLDP